MGSVDSKEWEKAMDEEIQSLNENNTFTLATLPKGKNTVGVDGFTLSKVI